MFGNHRVSLSTKHKYSLRVMVFPLQSLDPLLDFHNFSDNDGFITKEEFAKISKKLNRDQVEAVFAKFDKDGDGNLSFEEFKKMLKKDKK